MSSPHDDEQMEGGGYWIVEDDDLGTSNGNGARDNGGRDGDGPVIVDWNSGAEVVQVPVRPLKGGLPKATHDRDPISETVEITPTGRNGGSAAASSAAPSAVQTTQSRAGGDLRAEQVNAWFGTNHVLAEVSLEMRAKSVTALIGPSGCGKSTFLRILNRMHELVPSASLSGRVMLNGTDIYSAGQRPTDTRRRIGMVFQKPNPFPAMSIADNVVAGLKLTRTSVGDRQALIEDSLRRSGLWNEVRNRLKDAGGALSGGQQQRLCIARALAIRPDVLLMDEPCSALDPTSTRRIEETIGDIGHEVTIVIVTHNMQQAQRVSDRCAFFLAAENTPGRIVEEGPTEKIFNEPEDPQTFDYVNGRFG